MWKAKQTKISIVIISENYYKRTRGGRVKAPKILRCRLRTQRRNGRRRRRKGEAEKEVKEEAGKQEKAREREPPP